MDMVAQVKREVRKLCTKRNVAAQITANDKVDELRANIERMIHIDPELKVGTKCFLQEPYSDDVWHVWQSTNISCFRTATKVCLCT